MPKKGIKPQKFVDKAFSRQKNAKRGHKTSQGGRKMPKKGMEPQKTADEVPCRQKKMPKEAIKPPKTAE